MGEVPVLDHKGKRLAQSGVILASSDLAVEFAEGEDEKLEALRWMIFDNQKLNGYLAALVSCAISRSPQGDPAAMAFLEGIIDNSLGILEKRLARSPFVVGDRPTIADLWLVGCALPAGISATISRHASQHRGLARPYESASRLGVVTELMPGYPLAASRSACEFRNQRPGFHQQCAAVEFALLEVLDPGIDYRLRIAFIQRDAPRSRSSCVMVLPCLRAVSSTTGARSSASTASRAAALAGMLVEYLFRSGGSAS